LGLDTYSKKESNNMLRWALIFLIVAIVAGVLGFGTIAGAASSMALILFWVFLAICIVMFLLGLIGGGSARPLP
jgi:uncharacterized membrane protein YtjA (UPF0391 family)